jgi:Na+-translocating ferredoxin:NAD+ oxidoreductase RnfE subunit
MIVHFATHKLFVKLQVASQTLIIIGMLGRTSGTKVLILQLCPLLVIFYAHTPVSACFPFQLSVIFSVTISQCWGSLFRACNPLNTPQVVIFIIFDSLVHTAFLHEP